MPNYIKEIVDSLRGLDREQKRNFLFIIFAIFFTLFSYPFVRASSTAVFLNAFGAKSSPYVWIYSILALSIVITIYNRWQVRLSIHRLYLYTSLFSFVFLLVCLAMTHYGHDLWAYPLFVWKEVYIVLLVHMTFGFYNNSFDVRTAKKLYGIVGATGALSGVCGGLMTSRMTYFTNEEWILVFGTFSIVAAGIFFWFTDHRITLANVEKKEKIKESPLSSIKDVRNYVLLILAIVAISQFCINIVNFKFNMLFADIVPDKLMKTRYLGNIYSCINGLSLGFQLLIVPLAFRYMKVRTIHTWIPIIYVGAAVFGLGLGGAYLLPVAAAFVFFKGTDYSIFSLSKELLYFPLKAHQKYGAKYIVDIMGYRFAKGFISFALIFFQTAFAINLLLGLSLGLWLICLIPLFRARKKAMEINQIDA